LPTIVNYDGMGDTIPARYAFPYKFLNMLSRDGSKWFYLNPFYKIVYSY